MQRLWTDTRITIITSDSHFESTLVKVLPQTYEITKVDPRSVDLIPPSTLESSLVFWDLSALPAAKLRAFIQTRPAFTRSCSLLLLADSCDTPGLTELLHEGAVDFVLRDINSSELQMRMNMARRPWVKALETAFEFLAALDVDLTMTEQKVFLCFLRSPHFGAGRKDIMDKVWGTAHVHPNTLDVHLFNIRRKLEPSGIRITFTSAKACWTLTKSEKKAAALVENALSQQPTPLYEGHQLP